MSTIVEKPHLKEEPERPPTRLDALRSLLGQSDLGVLPILLGLVVIWGIFQLANPHFLSARNLTNLLLQAASTGTISIGLVLILLLGEIDLSVGAVSGLCGSIVAVLNVNNGVSGPIAVLAGLLAGLAIGLFQGMWITRFRIPSFIVTLAGLLGWQGTQLLVLGETGTINLRDPFVVGIANTFFPQLIGWLVGIIFVVIVIVSMLLERRQRMAAELPYRSRQAIIFRSALIAAAMIGSIAVLNADRGLPLAVIIFVGLIVLFDLITRRTIFGRHIYAVGGDPEAARRASINVNGIRVAVFGLGSMLAALGGILGESRLFAVNQSSGGSDTLLNAIAAAVIGGTSLFGGFGSVWSALVGALVIFSISNGMDLLALPSDIKFIITGGVLLVAVTIDAISRRMREVRGR
ncbi:MAG: sugar ABC transporter permease [Chloroflexi bacterium]|nr:sugar ABC transporter permease [Chloroflexota bacterium]